MNRREFVTLLGSAAVTWPITARAQHTIPTIGFLSSRSPADSADVVAAFRKGLAETGFIESRNLAIEFRWAEGHYDRLPELARDLVNMRVSLLFAAGGPPAALAAKQATPTIPIVFSATSDPVGTGLVALTSPLEKRDALPSPRRPSLESCTSLLVPFGASMLLGLASHGAHASIPP